MLFRKDINGLRAIAVIAVVLFHFNAGWLPGGFAGVDVFFVISGYLMTGIIFSGLANDQFSILKFYVARANRIIPALAFLCFTLLILGWFFIAPLDYRALGKHLGASIGFVSNFIYWKESGYFDASVHEKWLIHTWSLSTEWQFYILYPLLLVGLKKILSLENLKKTIIIATLVGFFTSIVGSYQWPEPAYYLLHTRAWEMLLGGVAFLYPLKISKKYIEFCEKLGLALIIVTYIFISKENTWPGWLAMLPTAGAFLVIQANSPNSFITHNFIFQKLGSWSYSIYLWHWPLVTTIYYFKLNAQYFYGGIALSVALGALSYRYIESFKFRNDFKNLGSYLRCPPIYMVILIGSIGSLSFLTNGFLKRAPTDYQQLARETIESPFRSKCHIESYRDPAQSCEYFGKNIEWAVLGDSHSVEIAYALAELLKPKDIGLKQLSFSGCKIPYQQTNNTSDCAQWYNESVNYLLSEKKIRNVVINHRFTSMLFEGDASKYPQYNNPLETSAAKGMMQSTDKLIKKLASAKSNIYVFYPIPELPDDIQRLIGQELLHKHPLANIYGTSLNWYRERNKYVIDHFNNAHYPANVHLLNTQDIFCDASYCFAVRNGTALYFDDDHPSLIAAEKLANLILSLPKKLGASLQN